MYNSAGKQDLRQLCVQTINSLDLKNKKAFIVPHYGLTDIEQITLPSGIATEDCYGIVDERDVCNYANEHGVETKFGNFYTQVPIPEKKFNVAIIDYMCQTTDKMRKTLQIFIKSNMALPGFLSIAISTPKEHKNVQRNYREARQWLSDRGVEDQLLKIPNSNNGKIIYRIKAIQGWLLQTIEEINVKGKIRVIGYYPPESRKGLMFMMGIHLIESYA